MEIDLYWFATSSLIMTAYYIGHRVGYNEATADVIDIIVKGDGNESK
jgi:hypothetical protein